MVVWLAWSGDDASPFVGLEVMIQYLRDLVGKVLMGGMFNHCYGVQLVTVTVRKGGRDTKIAVMTFGL